MYNLHKTKNKKTQIMENVHEKIQKNQRKKCALVKIDIDNLQD